MAKQKEYNVSYLSAKSVLNEEKRRTGSDNGQTNAIKPRRTSSDIVAELENHTVGRGPT
jgi:hypothetical protein